MNNPSINGIPASSAAERFLRYVQIDTQSDPDSHTCPSTEKQKDLGRLLVEELQAIGVADANLDEHGYVYATIPANTTNEVPTICFCSHMDTSPDSSGKHVTPIVHRNYQGVDISLPDDPNVVIRYHEHPDLQNQIGNDIITAGGTTLLGADDKAGIAEIMAAAEVLMNSPDIKHGTIKILFTPDEEIGRGVDKVDLAKLGAHYAYTVDGETAGSIEDETFSADGVRVVIQGISVHPGFAKGKLRSAIKIASEIVAGLPANRLSPESTSGRVGFVHPVSISGSVEEATIDFIVRDFNNDNLQAHEFELEAIVKTVVARYPGSTYDFVVKEQYRNMKQVLNLHPEVMEIGLEAIRRTGLQPIRRSIRGGTDGSRLSFMGLPCPNIFAGGHAFHGKQEWVSVQDMEKAVKTILHIATLWEEQSRSMQLGDSAP